MRKQITLLAVVGVLVVVFGTIYMAVQQSQRSDANYPQIQMSEDTAAQIGAGKDPHLSSLLAPVEISDSLAPFTIVYDARGNVVSGSGYLGKSVPRAPLGMLEDSKGKTFNAVTWQPRSGVRIATVTVAAEAPGKKTDTQYYVMSGRSLREVENNENLTLIIAAVGGVLSLLIVAAAIFAKAMVAVKPPQG